MSNKNSTLGGDDLMIVSKYFETIDDFINFEFSTPKAKGNMEKFHFNPIPLDEWSRRFFTSLETLHLYNREDNHFDNETFFRRIIHYEVTYKQWMEEKKEDVMFKNVILTAKESKLLDRIPEGVTKVGKECFQFRNDIKEIIVPNTVTEIKDSFSHMYELSRLVLPTNLKVVNGGFAVLNSLKELVIPESLTLVKNGFIDFCFMTSLTVPTHWERVGDRFYNNKPLFCSFAIPDTVKTINGKEVVIEEGKEFTIPS